MTVSSRSPPPSAPEADQVVKKLHLQLASSGYCRCPHRAPSLPPRPGVTGSNESPVCDNRLSTRRVLHPLNRVLEQLIPILQLQFLLDARPVRFDSLDSQPQLLGDLPRPQAPAQHLKHLQLSVRRSEE